jgi:hypothetical protein
MIQATIIPEKTDVNFSFPKDYIGKKVHAIFYIDEEISTVYPNISQKKPADFFGILTSKETKSFEKHTQQMRNEWNRDI